MKNIFEDIGYTVCSRTKEHKNKFKVISSVELFMIQNITEMLDF